MKYGNLSLYRIIYAKNAGKVLKSKCSRKLLKGIKDKMEWLSNNADAIEHEMLQGNLHGV